MIYLACYLTIGGFWSLWNYHLMKMALKIDRNFMVNFETKLNHVLWLKLVFYTLPLSWPIHVAYYFKKK